MSVEKIPHVSQSQSYEVNKSVATGTLKGTHHVGWKLFAWDFLNQNQHPLAHFKKSEGYIFHYLCWLHGVVAKIHSKIPAQRVLWQRFVHERVLWLHESVVLSPSLWKRGALWKKTIHLLTWCETVTALLHACDHHVTAPEFQYLAVRLLCG